MCIDLSSIMCINVCVHNMCVQYSEIGVKIQCLGQKQVEAPRSTYVVNLGGTCCLYLSCVSDFRHENKQRGLL